MTSTRSRRRDIRTPRALAWSTPVDVLEARRLLTLYTDVSQVAALTPAHSGPTNLFINFDGGDVLVDPANDPNGNPSGPTTTQVTVRPFEEEAGDGGLDRDQDIQEILFQVAQVYAPFNVQVRRIYGAGNYSTGNGDTTIFVGAIQSDSTQSGPVFTKSTYSFTLNTSVDSPTSTHTINSDKYDVAFMDPVQGSTSNPQATYSCQATERDSAGTDANIYDITRSIEHEAGHTFGLSHVRTDGLTDPSPLKKGTVDDIMSSDSPAQDYFADQSLTLTTANNNGTSITFGGIPLPSYLDTQTIDVGPFKFTTSSSQNLVTQNSFLTLANTLGYRPRDQYANVANPGSVDPAYYTLGNIGYGPGGAPKEDLSHSTSALGTLNRPGDDQVFTITPSVPTPSGYITEEHITVAATSGGLQPEILIYDSTGTKFLGFADPIDGTASISLSDGATYQVVVAAHDGDSTGSYQMKLGALSLPINLPPFGPIQWTTPMSTDVTISTPTTASTPTSGAATSGLGALAYVPTTVSFPSIGVLTAPPSEADEPGLA